MILEDFAQVYTDDRPLMEELGLDHRIIIKREWTLLGTVEMPKDEDYDGKYGVKHPTTIKVECSAFPAQFWRFTITRARWDLDRDANSGGYDGTEVTVLSTGSGNFRGYWEQIKPFVDNMIGVRGHHYFNEAGQEVVVEDEK